MTVEGAAEATHRTVDILVAHIEDFTDVDIERLALVSLSDAERLVASTFTHASRRRSFVLGRTLARRLLVEAYGSTANDVTLQVDAAQRPNLPAPMRALGADINIAHNDDRVVCALSRAGAIGIDVERYDRLARVDALSKRYFAPHECEALERCEAPARAEYFFALWSVKEAWAKALGLGIASALSRLQVRLDGRTGLRGTSQDEAGNTWSPYALHFALDGAQQGAVVTRAAVRALRVGRIAPDATLVDATFVVRRTSYTVPPVRPFV